MLEIKRSSHFIRIIFQALLIITPILFILFWIGAPNEVGAPNFGFSYSFLPQGINIMHELTLQDRILGFLISGVPTLIGMGVLFSLVRLFHLYEQGIVFTLDNVKYIKLTGLLLISQQIADFVMHPLMTLAMSLGNPPGHRYIALTLSDTNLGLLFFGLIVVIIAKIMKEATDLHNETKLTV